MGGRTNPTMTDYTPPLEDFRYLLNEVLATDRLYDLPAFDHADGELAGAVLDQAARFSVEVLAPLNAVGDAEGSRLAEGAVVMPSGFRQAYARYLSDGWPTLDMDRDFGGQGLPRVLQAAVGEMMEGACSAFGMLPLMQRAASRLLAAHAPAQTVQTAVPKLVSGEWGVTMCITEPQAGSDVGRVRARAEPRPDGFFSITGTKIFVSYGDHDLTRQILHLVLARTPGAAVGTRGLSLFLVPKVLGLGGGDERANAVTVSRLEHKMGLKASPTCLLDFDAAEGTLIGAEGGGLRAMFTMINTMRLGVSIQGVGIAGAATARALAYAAERPQGGPPEQAPVAIIEHADVRRMLLEMRSRSEGMRALVLETALNLDLAAAAESESERDEALALAEWLLPICKVCGSEAGFEVSNLAIQVFGGHGYITESGVEQYARDARVQAIYEGTNGIQALDLVTRKLGADGGRRYAVFAGRLGADLDRLGADPSVGFIGDALAEGLMRLEEATAVMTGRLASAPRQAQAAATPYIQLAGLVAQAWMWLRMAAVKGESPQHRAKRALARFFAEYMMPAAALYAKRIEAGAAPLDALGSEELAG